MKEQSDQGLHCHSICIIWMKEQSDQGLHCFPFHEGAVWSQSTLFAHFVCIREHSVCIVWIKEQSDQGLHCLPFRLDEGAVWSGSTLFAFLFASFGQRSNLIRVYTVCHSVCIVWWRSSLIWVYPVCHSIRIVLMKEQCDQGLHCLPFRLHHLDEGVVWSGSPLSFYLHRLDEGTVRSGSTLFAIPFASFGWLSSLIRVYTVYHSICTIRMKEQSDQGLHYLPFRLHRLDEGVVWSGSTLSFRLHRLDEGAVWSGSTLFAIPFASFGWMSSLIRVYTVCHSFCTVWMNGAVWSESTLFAIPFTSFGWRSSLIRVYSVIPFASFGWRSSLIRVYTVCHSMKEQSDQSLHCLPLRLHEGAFRLHRLDKGAVWSGSTLFAIPFASFGWRSSLIRVYTVCHSICIFLDEGAVWSGSTLPFCLDEGAVWSGSTLFAIPWRSSLIRVYTVCHFVCMKEHSVCIVWIKEQSDQGLHCLPFRLDEGAVWSGSTLFAFPFA